jgi:WD40-like Beta Propeller Repeat
MYASSNAAAGHVTVTASSAQLAATASLTVQVTATIVDSTFPPPGDPSTLFPSGAEPVVGGGMASPSVLYPADGTAFPQGVASTVVQYAPGMTNDSFELTFANDVLQLVVFTGASRWAATGPVWSLIASSGIGDPIELTVDATDSTGSGAIYAAPPIALDFSADSPSGSIYYWSAATNGVMQGALAAPSAGKLYPTTTTCAGCHTVSRDASAMAMGYGDENNPDLAAIALPGLQTVIDPGAKLPTGWATYSPDGTLLLVAVNGMLTLYDARAGTSRGPVALPPMKFATHPDWSPDGSSVAVALTSMMPNDKDVNGASIALLPFANGAFGPPQVLVATTGMDNAYFPRWSPDGTFIAYVHATTSSHAAMSAELELVAATGGPSIVLANASGTNLADTMPTWAPARGSLAWLAFSSARPYGSVMPMQQAQVWVAGVDLAGASATGADPSFAAFWLPCQDVTVLNNNPIWSGDAASVDASHGSL